jgi:hypothetical protein
MKMAAMKRQGQTLGVVLLMAVSISLTAAHASDAARSQESVQAILHCYGLAMVGMDSVINSRLGIYPELILHLATIDPGAAIASPEEISSAAPYSTRLLRIIYEAYLWQGEPHEYALQVLASCST